MSGPWSRLLLRSPKSSDENFIGDPRLAPDKFVEAYASNSRVYRDYLDRKVYAHGMHERCWLLATRTLDADMTQNHLDLFIRALYRVPDSFFPRDERTSWSLNPSSTIHWVHCTKNWPLNWRAPPQDPWKIVDIPKFIRQEKKA